MAELTIEQSVKQIVETQRELASKHGTQSAEYKNYVEKSDARMEAFDTKNEELVAKLAQEEIKKEELKERIIRLEAVSALGSGSKNIDLVKASNETMNAMLKGSGAWMNFVQDPANLKSAGLVLGAMSKHEYSDVAGADHFARIIKQYGEKASADLLRSDIGELGGFLCPPEWSNELNKNMIEYSPVRNLVRVKTTGSKIYREPIRVGIPRAERPGEANAGTNSNSTYAMNDFTPVRMTNTIGVTQDELLFNGYNLASELMLDNAEAFAVREGEEFFSGSGVSEGLGFTVDTNVPTFTTDTTTLTFDDMINITGELKQGYNPMYCFNRRTLAYLRTLKDQNDRYLWNGPFGDAASGSPATINGIRYSAQFIDFDDYDVSGGVPVLFADMMRFYQIVDRQDMTVIRDEYSRKKEGVVEFTTNKWSFGKTKIAEAGIKMVRKS